MDFKAIEEALLNGERVFRNIELWTVKKMTINLIIGTQDILNHENIEVTFNNNFTVVGYRFSEEDKNALDWEII